MIDTVTSLFDAPDRSVLVAAVSWIEQALLGSVGTAIAVVSIAWLGFAMLRGHLPVRRGGAALLGCFILFGAGGIARGLVDIVGGAPTNPPQAVSVASPVANISPPSSDNADPYANGNLLQP